MFKPDCTCTLHLYVSIVRFIFYEEALLVIFYLGVWGFIICVIEALYFVVHIHLIFI